MMGGIESFVGGFGVAVMWTFMFSVVALLAFLAWTLSEAPRREEKPVVVRSATYGDVLRERLERGEISAREFEEALRVLRDS